MRFINCYFVFLAIFLFLFNPVKGQNSTGKVNSVNIVFIGNSITQGVLLENPLHSAPPVRTAIYLKKKLRNSTIRYVNKGVSGCTTMDYLPATETLFPKMQQVADLFRDESWADLIFSIMLGTNDSASEGPNGSPVSKEKYVENMKDIINRLLALYPNCKIVLHRPIWYSENTYNSARYLTEGQKRLQSYFSGLKEIITYYSKRFPKQVFMGDIDAFDYFKINFKSTMIPENGKKGVFYLHPNRLGADKLGEFWGKAILRIL